MDRYYYDSDGDSHCWMGQSMKKVLDLEKPGFSRDFLLIGLFFLIACCGENREANCMTIMNADKEMTALFTASIPSGDINGDGMVNAIDIVAAINHLLGLQTWIEADINKDGLINALDVVFIINLVLDNSYVLPKLYSESVDKGVVLYWEGVESNSSINLEWSKTEDFDHPILLAENLDDSFLHTGLENGSQNFYRINVMSLNSTITQSTIVNAIPAGGLRINISNMDDIDRKRRVLRKYIWGDPGKPENSQLFVEKSVTDTNFKFLKPGQNNLAAIDRYRIFMPYGAGGANEQIESIVYHFHPSTVNGEAFIYHAGHGYGFQWEEEYVNEVPVISRLIAQGYSVIAFSMPLQDINSENSPIVPGTNEPFTWFSILGHEELFQSFGKDFFHFFFDPLWLTIDYLERNYNYKRLHMTGLSGGAWTTTVYSAIDERIDFSYPVAGSIPILYRPAKYGDIEQLEPLFYAITTYEELYLMASVGNRRHIQILNEIDSCCFGANSFPYWEWRDIIKEKLASLLNSTGYYDLYVELKDTGHFIRENTLNFIINDASYN